MLHIGSQETGHREGRSVLHVLFLAGGNGLAAKLAADWTRLLADGCMEVEAADPDGVDSTAAFTCAPAGLAVVIHAPGCSGPVVAHNCGGRIDWHLTVDVNEGTAELNNQLCRHVMRLLGDLGIGRPLMATMTPRSCLPGPDRANARLGLLAA
ncbi:MAG: hypothetical protein ROZ09_06230 [Thiobacillus sp.]|jgi:hypothetical protein|uniref:hypothetical protein n=1 Tax=Thiobacillus sp. TaxID=924 RepID=UPI0028952B49|nr:hypothetical protein [Thiobacillus sp.]MDT3706407.1 hypothetical protein [Thiobacillus sp.]